MTKTALILGATGRAGKHAADAFAAAGWTTRAHDRQNGDMIRDAQGCDVIVNAMNPPNYHDWATLIPQMTQQVIAAARASGAAVILPGNVYHFGDQGGIWSEHTPARPVSRKGHIRLQMEQTYAASGVQTIVLRAGNFIDPAAQGCVMSMLYLRALEKGRITLPGPADVRQAFCYLPDWARAAAALADQRAALPAFADIPFAGHTLTGNEIRDRLSVILNRELTFARFPWWAMRATTPVWELAREMLEMRYLWQTDHALSDTALSARLPDFQPTPTDQVLARVAGAVLNRDLPLAA